LDVIGEKYPKPQEDSMDTDRPIESPPLRYRRLFALGRM
jgi:hypothetical protein